MPWEPMRGEGAPRAEAARRSLSLGSQNIGLFLPLWLLSLPPCSPCVCGSLGIPSSTVSLGHLPLHCSLLLVLQAGTGAGTPGLWPVGRAQGPVCP